MTHLLLADSILGVDPPLIIYLVIIIASVVGGIIQQSKQEKDKKGQGSAPRGEGRSPAEPTGRETTRLPSPPESPGPIVLPPPERRPQRPPLRARPPQPRPRRPAESLPELLSRPQPTSRTVSVASASDAERDEIRRAPLPTTAAARSTGDAAAIRVRQSRARVLALLRQRESLQTAFMLQEVLSPPLALRDERTNPGGR